MLRFAPSPTGDMHIGNLRAAIFNYIIAKQTNQPFLIRIEDTDIARNIEGKDKEILSLLNLFGLLWDKLVYQSHNFSHHQKIAEYLIAKDKAFYCYCTKEFLDQKREEAKAQKRAFRYDESWAEIHKDSNPKPVVRLRGAREEIGFVDEIKGEISFNPNEIDSFVILKDDGIPTYNFACAIDDMLYDISFIVRGEDHVSNTPRQILVRKYLDYTKDIGYAHLPIILGESGSKMSKRDNASSVAIEWFDIKNIAKSPVKFDIKKLRFINREHLKMLNESELALLLSTKDPSIGGLAKLYLQEASTLNEIRDKIDSIFSPKDIYALYEGQDFSEPCRILYEAFVALIAEHSLALREYESLKAELLERTGQGSRVRTSLSPLESYSQAHRRA